MPKANPRSYVRSARLLLSNPIDYGASKAALLQLARYLAVHYGPSGLRFNCVTPGPFPNPAVQRQTDFTRGLTEQLQDAGLSEFGQRLAGITRRYRDNIATAQELGDATGDTAATMRSMALAARIAPWVMASACSSGSGARSP